MSTDDFDTTMLELFREEADTQLGALAEALVALETAAEPRALLDDLMRAAHSMKGAARIVGLDPVVKLAHSAEDIFVAALRGELPQVDRTDGTNVTGATPHPGPLPDRGGEGVNKDFPA